MSDDRTELLRTQAVQHLLSALGAANVHIYGNELDAGGVFLENDREMTSRTYWRTNEGRWEYSVKVSVDVERRKVSE